MRFIAQFILLTTLLSACNFGDPIFLGEAPAEPKPQLDAMAIHGKQIRVFAGYTNVSPKVDSNNVIPRFNFDCEVSLTKPDGSSSLLSPQVVQGTYSLWDNQYEGFVFYSNTDSLSDGQHILTARFPNGEGLSSVFNIAQPVDLQIELLEQNIERSSIDFSEEYDKYKVTVNLNSSKEVNSILHFQIANSNYPIYFASDDQRFISATFEFESEVFFVEGEDLFFDLAKVNSNTFEVEFFLPSYLQQSEESLFVNHISNEYRLYYLAVKNQGNFGNDPFSEPLNIPTNVDGGVGFCSGIASKSILLP